MPIATVQLPNGKIADIEIPQGATPQEIESFVMSQPEFAKQEAPAQQALQAPQPAQAQPETFQEANRRRAGQFAQGLPQGLGNAAVGAVQAATDVGEKAAQLIERLYFGDNLQMNTFGNRLANQVKTLKEQQAQLPTSEQAGISVGEIAPFLATGAGTGARVLAATGSKAAGMSAGGAVGGATISALSPQEEAGLGNRAVNTLAGGATGAVAAPIIGKAVNVITNAPNAAKELIKKLVGIDPIKVAKFADAGLDPTLANVSKYRPVSQIQNFLSATPGASARIDRVIQHQIDNVANKSISIAGSKGGTIEQAGNIIGTGAKAYKKTLGDRANAIYEDVYSRVPKDTKIDLKNTKDLVNNDLSLQEVAATSDFIRRKIERFNQITSPEIFGDAANALSRIKVFRSSIGKDSGSATLTGNERGALKKIYGSLSGDLKEGVLATARQNFGEDEAIRIYGKFNAADNLYGLQQDYIKKTITPLEKAKTPDKIYSIATSGIKNGGVQIENVFRALNEDQKSFVRGSLISRMGKAPQSVQDETGNVFSLGKFRQDYTALSDEAKKAIFTPRQVSEYDKLIKASSEIERTGRLGKINSATAQAVGWGGLTGAVISPYLSLPAAAGIVGGARITAGMMTNPRFVNWLSQQAKVNGSKAIESSLGRLGAIAIASDDSSKEDIVNYMANLSPISNANAEDSNDMSEEEIRNNLIKNKKLRPILMDGININKESKKIKKRYYR